MAATATQIHELYIAYFGRAADAAGVDYWTQSGAAIEDIASAFGDSKQVETASTYALIKDPTLVNSVSGRSDFIDAIYSNLFGRTADAAGKTYWDTQLKTGAVSVSQFILAVINGAQGDDAALIANKVAASEYFVAQQAAQNVTLLGVDLNGNGIADYAEAGQVAQSVLTGITADSATVDAKKAGIDVLVANYGAQVANGVDITAALDANTNGFGTSGNDVLVLNSVLDLGNYAKIDALGGTDTLKLAGPAASVAVAADAAKLAGFEVVELGAGASVDASLFTASSLQKVVVDVAGTVTTNDGLLISLKDDAAVIVNDKLDTSADYVRLETNGNATVTLNPLSNYEAAYVTAKAGGTVTINPVGIADGAKLVLNSTVTGTDVADTVTLNASATHFATIDASASTGALAITATDAFQKSVTTGAGADSITVSGGSTNDVTVNAGAGNDAIDVTLTGALKAVTLTGGAGNDNFVLTNAVGGVIGAGADTKVLVSITDFTSGQDTLDFGLLKAAFPVGNLVNLSATDLGLTATSTLADAFTVAANNAAGQVDAFQFGGDTYVVLNGGAAGTADDVVVKLAGAHTLTLNDLHFA